MDAQQLVEIARQFGGDQGGHRPGFAGHRPRPRRGLTRGQLLRLVGSQRKQRSEKAQAFESQARFANATGRNRTKVFLIPAVPGAKATSTNGRGYWKKWTCEAVLRAAFSNESMAVRHVAEQVDGASASHAAQCKLFVANLIFKGQQAGLQRLIESQQDADGFAFDFAMINCIFDETELEVNLHEYGLGEWSILASHSQMSFGSHQETQDYDVIRLPVALPNKQATTMWEALCCGDGGLWPGLTRVPARFRVVLITCDSAPANLKLLRHLQKVLDPRTLCLPFPCLQHRTGNCIERLTKLMGTLTGPYAVSKTLRSGGAVRRIMQHVRKVLQQKLQVIDRVPPGLEDEWATGQVCARQILHLAHRGDEAMEEGEREGKADIVEEFLKFFQGPWTGPMCGGIDSTNRQ